MVALTARMHNLVLVVDTALRHGTDWQQPVHTA